MATSFETLSNEIVYCIFDYLDHVHIAYAYYHLNDRYNRLVSHYVKFIDLVNRSFSYCLLKNCCNIFPFLGSNIIVLKVGNPSRRSEMELFGDGIMISTVYPNLTVLWIKNASHIRHIIPYLNDLLSFSTLKKLQISVVEDNGIYMDREKHKFEVISWECITYVLDKLFYTQHPSLMHVACHSEQLINFSKPICATNIKRLSISVLKNTSDLLNLLTNIPNLEVLDVRLSSTEIDNSFKSIPSILKLKVFILKYFERTKAYDLKILEAVIKRCPYLFVLSLEMESIGCSNRIDGHYFEKELLSHCKYLKRLYFYLRIHDLSFYPSHQRNSIMQSFSTDYWHQQNWSASFYIDNFTIILHSIPFPCKNLQDFSIETFQYNIHNTADWSIVNCLTYTTTKIISQPLLQDIAVTFKNLTALVFNTQVELLCNNIIILHHVRSLQLNSPMKKTFLKSIFSITPKVKTLKIDGTQLLAYTPRLHLTSLHVMGADMSQFGNYIINYPDLEILQITCNSTTNSSCQISMVKLFDYMKYLRSLSITVRPDRNPYSTVHSSSSVLKDITESIGMSNNMHYREQTGFIQIWR